MSEAWGHYFANMGGHTASILFDDGIAEEIESMSLEFSLRIKIPLREWNSDGLTTNDEASRLDEFERKVADRIAGSNGALLGRVTSNRVRWVMALLPVRSEEICASVHNLAADAGYKAEVFQEHDPKKKIYWRDLYPTDDDRRVMWDMGVLKSLSEHGDDHRASRRVDHWSYFGSATDAETFSAWAAHEGYFDVRVDTNDSEVGEAGEWRVQTAHEGTMLLNDITKHTLRHFRKAAELDGRYDGWETFVVTSN